MARLLRFFTMYAGSLAYAFWVFAVGPFNARARYGLYVLGQEAPWNRLVLPAMSAAELIGDVPRLTLQEVGAVDGNVSILELAILVRLAETRQPKALFEFGTFDGRTALNLIAHSPPDARLFTLDLPASQLDATALALDPKDRPYVDKTESGARFLSTEYAARITRLSGDSALFDFSPYFGAIDLIFIDASHAYDYVRSDTLNAMKMIRPSGGVVLWHDYSREWRGVTRALHEFYRSGGPFRGLRRVEGTTLVILRS